MINNWAAMKDLLELHGFSLKIWAIVGVSFEIHDLSSPLLIWLKECSLKTAVSVFMRVIISLVTQLSPLSCCKPGPLLQLILRFVYWCWPASSFRRMLRSLISKNPECDIGSKKCSWGCKKKRQDKTPEIKVILFLLKILKSTQNKQTPVPRRAYTLTMALQKTCK